MDKKMLGKRIREARLAKKMTQSEVVGTFITRNMLSQIESGIAMPSMKTLEFLSEVLEVSVPMLLGNTEAQSFDTLKAAKEAFKAGDNDKVIDLLGTPEENQPLYDEYCALLAKAYSDFSDEKSQENANYYKSQGVYAER